MRCVQDHEHLAPGGGGGGSQEITLSLDEAADFEITKKRWGSITGFLSYLAPFALTKLSA